MRVLSRFTKIVATGAVIVLAMTGCAAGEPKPSDDKLVGIAWADSDRPGRAEVLAKLKAAGFTVSEFSADWAVKQQANQAETLLKQGVKLLIVDPVSDKSDAALNTALKLAKSDKVPVLAIIDPIQGTGDYDYFVGFDYVQAGSNQADKLLAGLGLIAGDVDSVAQGKQVGDGKTIAILAGPESAVAAKALYQGAMSRLSPLIASGKLTVAGGKSEFSDVALSTWEPTVAQSKLDALLAQCACASSLAGVLSPRDTVSEGVLASLAAAGVSLDATPVITGGFANFDTATALEAGNIFSSFLQDWDALAAEVAKAAGDLIAGAAPTTNTKMTTDSASIPATLIVPPTVTKHNLEVFGARG